MDARLYKDLRTKSGVTYHTFVSPPKPGKSTILFIHGFPSSSADWRNQVPFFVDAGYGVVVPDLLGHGASDKPADMNRYLPSAVTADLVDILDQVKAGDVIAVGHDWGTILASRLAAYYPTRFLGFAFLAGSYSPFLSGFDLNLVLSYNKERYNSELFGYWSFLAETNAHVIIEKRLESMLSIWHPADPAVWKAHLTQSGALKAWLIADNKTPVASYLSSDDKARILAEWRKPGAFAASLNWFKLFSTNRISEDDKRIDLTKLTVEHPVFFGACQNDAVCLAEPGKAVIQQFCPRGTIVDFPTGHWVQLEAPSKLNKALGAWVDGVAAKK